MKAISKIEDLIHNETKGLPEPLLNEILDFILFLKHKKLAPTSKKISATG